MKKKKSYTLLETVVTIVIYAFLLLMVTNIVLINAQLSEKLKIRSRIRSEMAEVVSLIRRDIRNADTINYVACSTISCEMTLQGHVIIWRLTGSSIEKVEQIGVNYLTKFSSASYVQVSSVNFSIIPDNDILSRRATVILTIRAQGANARWGVTNQVLQEIISTRNYSLSF